MMQAGPELDSLVAEKVLELEAWEPPKDSKWAKMRVKSFIPKMVPESQTVPMLTPAPQYSQSISTAWNIIVKVREWDQSHRDLFQEALAKVVQARAAGTEVKTGTVRGKAEAVVGGKLGDALLMLEPVDICLAALIVVGEKVE